MYWQSIEILSDLLKVNENIELDILITFNVIFNFETPVCQLIDIYDYYEKL